MDRYRRNQRRARIDETQLPTFDDDDADHSPPGSNNGDASEGDLKLRRSSINIAIDVDQEPFMGKKVRRKASLHRDYRGDYLDVPSQPYLMKILNKQGDGQVFFADKVLKFTGSGKIKRRILIVTDFAIYIVDPDTFQLKRRIALAAAEKIYLSELSDNFFAIIFPTEYDLLLASTRKNEIVTVLVDAIKSSSNYELEVVFSNRFEYNAAADLVKEAHFEQVEGGVKTSFLRK